MFASHTKVCGFNVVPTPQVIALDGTQTPAPSQFWLTPGAGIPQTVPADSTTSAGQLAEVPVQLSAGSQSPAEARHSVVDGSNELAGQLAEVPVQLSAGSQAPAEARHVVPALPGSFTHDPMPKKGSLSQKSLVQGLVSIHSELEKQIASAVCASTGYNNPIIKILTITGTAHFMPIFIIRENYLKMIKRYEIFLQNYRTVN